MAIVLGAAAAFTGHHTAHADGPAAPPAPTQLTVGDRSDPLDIQGAPQLGRMPASSKGNDKQTAYEVTVSKAGTTVWDSGTVASCEESYVPYAGPALADGTSSDWTVRTWDRDDQASPAATGHFERADAYDIEPSELDEHYRKRTTLEVNSFPADMAHAVVHFASERRSGKSTGNMLDVDGGVPPACAR